MRAHDRTVYSLERRSHALFVACLGIPDLDLCAWKALDGLILHVVVVVVVALESASGGSFFVIGLLPPPQPLFLGAIRRTVILGH
jgi:hypothetical protein